MSNTELELNLIQKFGLDRTISFCEMNAYIYNLMYEDFRTYHPNEICDFDYDRDWWSNKYNALTKMKEHERTRTDDSVPEGN